MTKKTLKELQLTLRGYRYGKGDDKLSASYYSDGLMISIQSKNTALHVTIPNKLLLDIINQFTLNEKEK